MSTSGVSPFDAHRAPLASPPIEFRPELRWWLAEGLHTDETLRREIDTAHRLGFGGMEFLAMDEGEIDHARYGWGAEEWVHDSQVVVEETTARGMSVSFTSGTNWSNANVPTIHPEHPAAAKELNVAAEDLAAGERRSGALPRVDPNAERAGHTFPGHRATVTDQTLVAVVATRVVDDGNTTVLDASSAIDLTAAVVDEELDWSAPDDGHWRLQVFWMHGTGQTASPSATVNYTVSYVDPEGIQAVIDYWRDVVLTPELRDQIAQNPRTQMYMDSLELDTYGEGGLFWGRVVPEEFRRRRGYDIAPWLPFLTREVPFMAATTRYRNEPTDADAVEVAKVRFDYVRTLTDLYIENTLRPFATFLHEVGITLRSEISYGLPFELTRPGPEVDGIETESLEFGAQIDAYRLLAGPAHLFRKQYSSETGATTRNHVLDHRFYDQIIATQLAAGVTKTVLHGWASPAGAEGATSWPGHEGMWPMFSERFDTRQPGSELYPLWNDAIGRVQYLLRQGNPRIDVGILRTDHFVDNTVGLALITPDGARIPDEVAYGTMWMRDRENHWWRDLGMQDAGWSYEFLDGELLRHDDVVLADGLVQPDGPGYQALIVYQEALDPDVARLLLDWARQGLRVLLVDGVTEVKVLAAGTFTHHEAAAVRTQGRDGRDHELATSIQELLTLPTVARASSPAQTLPALRELGVVGRAEFAGENRSLLTHLREEGDLLHLYVYHFLYETAEPTTVDLTLPGSGAVHRVDVWSGVIRDHDGVRPGEERTVVTLTLAPGEIALLTLDRSVAPSASAPATTSAIVELDDWQIAVESWDAGPDEIIEEDRGLGYRTREVRPTTAVTTLPVTGSTLRPWTDIAEVGPEVSGVGSYTSSLTLADVPQGGRLLLDLGSTAGGLAAVRVNGGEPLGVDTSHPVADVTGHLVAGENLVEVRVTSSLNNRLLARGYYDEVPDVLSRITGEPGMQHTVPLPHGLLGPVRLLHEQR